MAYGQKEVGERVKDFSFGLVSNASDLMALAINYSLDLGSVSEHPWDQAANEAIKDIKFSTLKRAITHLKSKEYIQETQSDAVFGYRLTDIGKEYIQQLLPHYIVERNWNGKVYLVNYDLPVSSNTARNSFREYLKSIGFGMIQHSLWLNPYDPRSKLMNYINNNDEVDKEYIIVSSMNLETELYGYQIPNLVDVAYGLYALNKRYKDFVKESDRGLTRERKIFAFLSILKDDPQVPYELLPADWSGFRAKEIFDECF